jgi:GT2 family glycosyltransferase
VNNDTEFTPGLIQTLVDQLEADKSIGICSPKIRYYDQPDTLQYAGFTAMHYRTARNKCVGEFEKDLGQYDHLTGHTAFIHGAAMMVRASAAAKAGLMAENYFLYYEEMDWCEQFRKAGYTMGLNMQALIYHKESMSVGKNSALKVFFMNRNRLLFIRKNTSISNYCLFFLFFLLVVTPRNMLQYIKEGNPGYCIVLLRAIWWNCIHSVHSTQLGYRL